MTPKRPHRAYDHRLVQLVQESGDVSIATRLGVPRSTAAGWIRRARPAVTSVPELESSLPRLRLRVSKLERRVRLLTAVLRVLVAVARIVKPSFSSVRVATREKGRLLRATRGAARETVRAVGAGEGDAERRRLGRRPESVRPMPMRRPSRPPLERGDAAPPRRRGALIHPANRTRREGPRSRPPRGKRAPRVRRRRRGRWAAPAGCNRGPRRRLRSRVLRGGTRVGETSVRPGGSTLSIERRRGPVSTRFEFRRKLKPIAARRAHLVRPARFRRRRRHRVRDRPERPLDERTRA